jgi:hypothetical protein
MGRARGAVVGGGGMVERWRGRAGGEAVTRGQKRAVGKGRVGSRVRRGSSIPSRGGSRGRERSGQWGQGRTCGVKANARGGEVNARGVNVRSPGRKFDRKKFSTLYFLGVEKTGAPLSRQMVAQ